MVMRALPLTTLLLAVFASACVSTPTGDAGGTGGGGTASTGGGTASSGGGTASPGGAIYDASTLARESTLSSADFTLFREHRYYFGHQSVGANLMTGLGALGDADARYKISVQWAYQAVSAFQGPGMFDKFVGENYQPYQKISDFDAQVRTTLQVGNHVDVAFTKFCYVDLSESTDVAALAQAYITEMEALETAFTNTTFLWTTAPLTASADAANVKRNQYAQLIRNYASTHGKPLYDLAALEAVSASGARCQFTSGGATYDRLCTDWEASAGDPHLNAAAGQRFAKVLALGLIDVLKR